MAAFWDARRARWSYDFQRGGKRFSGYCLEPDGTPCTSQRGADQAEARAKVAAERGARHAPASGGSYTVAQAFIAYATVASRKKASWANQRGYAAELVRWLGPDTALVSIGETKIAEYVAWSRQQPVKVWLGGRKKPTGPDDPRWRTTATLRTDSTINRYLDALRKTFGLAHQARDPFGERLLKDPPTVTALREPTAPARPIGRDDVAKLLRKAAPHVADGAALAVTLGLRRAEAFSLTIDHADLEHRGVWLEAGETKGGRGEFLPANADAMAVLTRLVRQARRRGIKWLVAWRRTPKHDWQPVRDPKRAIRNALRRAGIDRHRFHDLKASYSSALATVAPAKVVQILSRHRDFRTTERYILVADQELRSAVDKIAGRVAGTDLTRSHGGRSTEKSPRQSPRPPREAAVQRRSKPLRKLVGAAGFEPTTPSPPD